MYDNSYYLVVKFLRKIDFSRSSIVSFEPISTDIGRIDEKGNFSPINDSILLHCVNEYYDYNDITVFYGFPFELSNSDNLADENEIKKFFGSFSQEYFKLINELTYFPVLSSKDGRVNPIFCAINDNEEVFYPDFSKPITLLLKSGNSEIVDNDTNNKSETTSKKEILKLMKERIICQDEQVETLVNSILSNQKYGNYEGLKENILIIGPTGTGKTEMVSSLAKIIDVPFVKKDATKYSTTGYVGDSVIELLKSLYIESGCNLKKAETGIIAIDEFDKLGKKNEKSGVRSTDVQQELLGIIEGGDYTFEVDRKEVSINTSKITFVLMGAFQDVIKKINKREKTIGFNSNNNDITKTLEKKVSRQDLIEIGGIEDELLRRIPVIIETNQLHKDELKQILTKSKISNLKVWQDAFFKEDNVKLVCLGESLDLISKEAEKLGAGASGLKSVMNSVLSNIRSDVLDGNLYDCEVVITEETVKDPTKYLVKKIGKKGENSEFSKYFG